MLQGKAGRALRASVTSKILNLSLKVFLSEFLTQFLDVILSQGSEYMLWENILLKTQDNYQIFSLLFLRASQRKSSNQRIPLAARAAPSHGRRK